MKLLHCHGLKVFSVCRVGTYVLILYCLAVHPTFEPGVPDSFNNAVLMIALAVSL